MAPEQTPAPTGGDPIAFTLEQPESWKRVAHVEVEPGHVESLRQAVAERIRKKARLKGFRPGKAPLKLIRSSFASEIEQESIESLIPEAYRAVLAKEEGLHPIADPRVTGFKMDEGEPVRFDLVIEVRPELEVTGLDQLAAEKKVTPIGDEDVDGALRELRERNANWVEVERGAVAGDALLIDYVPLADDGNPLEDERNPGYAMELGTQNVLPEFNSALHGLQPGEDTEFEVNYPADFPNEELAGATMKFRVQLKELKEKQLPELDDDFAKAHTPFDSADELRADVRRDLERQARRHDDRELREALVDQLLDRNAVPVPESLERRYIGAMLQDIEQRGGGEGLDDEQRQKLAEGYRPTARRAVQRMVLMDNLRRQFGVEVGDEDITARVRELAEERDVKPEQMRQALESNRAIERLRDEIEEDRIFAALLEKAKVTEVERERPAQGEA